MTSQGGEPAVAADSSSMEPVGAGQSHGSVYSSLNLGPQSWASSTGELGISSSAYNYDPQRLTSMAGDAQGITPVANSSTSSNPVAATQPYSGYAPYSSPTIPYNYEATGYPNYHYGHQQSDNDSFAQQLGDQNSGAAYQPLSTFQNSGSYAPTSYFGTYYNTGDNQTDQPGPGYKSNDYNYQTSMWNNGNYQNYHHYYSSYTTSAATSVTQSSATTTTNSLYYQQEYNKWPYYYNQSTPSVNGVAGTEFSAVANLQSAGYSTGGLSVGYPYSSNQPPPPGTTSWKGETRPPGVPSVHEKEAAMPYNLNKTWEAVAPGIHTPAINQLPHAQNPLIQTPPTENHDNEQKILYPQASAPNLQHSTSNHGTQIFQPPQQTVPLTEPRQVSKMQIPTNPRITTNMGFSTSKSQKEASAVSVSTRPAYVSVTMPKPNDRSSSIEDSSRAIKGTFPPSLCAYVDRTFARCKDDAQRSDNQNIMKQIIAKATADGTLFTKNWDIEPLFPLSLEQSDKQSFISDSSLRTAKRSPSKRKSRWEPIPDEALGEKPTTADIHMPKNVSWGQVEAAKKAVENKSSENKLANGWGGLKFVPAQQQSIAQKFNPRLKKPRISDTLVATENTDHSSDSDKEQNLTKYHASALALADSPEEKRRRENRSKRFERGQGNQTDARNFRPKIASGGGIHTRRASALQNAKNFEDGFNKAVEDIDWDSLTVKGTCQEIEKRYLRLTSAPDPSTVRPEDVLEKALFMVQTSPKNYLYKCDQLKSIRQDLTVQRIQNALTVKVYETHARLSLEAGDLPEYNQCQSQLKRLYSEGIEGCYMEFSSYNLLSIILHSNNKRDLLSSMARLSVEAKRDEAVKHAVAVHSAVSSGNYILFFRLYKSAPNLNSYFMDLYAEKMRFEALKCMCKACRPVVPVAYITRVLGFSKSIQDDILEMNIPGFEECEEWLRAHGAVLSVDNTGELQLDTKVSSSTVYMPEQEDAVAHGDANLAVDDFLTRAA